MIHNNIITAIGNTPLIKIDFGTPPTIFAKLEYMNPSGSIKDRSVKYMIEAAEQRGDLSPHGRIIEASSGNQGIAASMIGALKGYPVSITVSEKISREKQDAIAAYGAHVIPCPHTNAISDPNSYHAHACTLAKETPGSYFINQYYNPDNITAHYNSLGPELWQQTRGTITHLCAGVGSGGTITGAGHYLKEHNANIHILGVDSPCSYRSTSGNPQPYQLEGLGVDYDTPLLDNDIVDEFLLAPDTTALSMFRWLPRTYGIFPGVAGAAVAAMVYEYSKTLSKHHTLVMIFGDSGRAYLSKEYI